MDDKGISYEMLQDLLRAERRSNKLTPVQPRFWSRVREFLVEVKEAFRVEQEKDPFSRKAMMLRDEVQHAKQAAESLWALRERKMALHALAHGPGSEAPEGITRMETEMYDAFTATLAAGRERVLQGGPVPKPETPPSEPKAAPAEVPAPEPAEAEPKAPEPAAPVEVPADTPSEDMVTIRAVADIPPFVGSDMQTYLLKEGDMAMVPKAIANLLERRGKAELMA